MIFSDKEFLLFLGLEIKQYQSPFQRFFKKKNSISHSEPDLYHPFWFEKRSLKLDWKQRYLLAWWDLDSD